MKDLYLMRHGQTFFNQEGLVQGACDSPLTELGQNQARQAGAYLQGRGIRFGHLYSSTQERASDTLELVSGRTDYTRLKGIKEWNFGLFEAQPERLQPKFRPGATSFEDLFVPYGGEGVDQVGERVLVTLTEVKVRFGNCAICHYHYEQGHFKLAEVIDPLTGSVYECETSL